MENKLAVVSLGHEALGDNTEEQKQATRVAAKVLADLIGSGRQLAITHSNGPQVSMIHKAMTQLHRIDIDYTAAPMCVCSAMSQGYIGYDLQNNLHCELRNRGLYKTVVTLITQVTVDPYDEAFYTPNKTIGRLMNKEDADAEVQKGNFVEEVEGKGYLRAVAAPKPITIVELDAIKTLIGGGINLIACGGGGIPVLAQDKNMKGASAVIEKDAIAGKLAADITADELIILTSVPCVYLDFGKEGQRAVEKMTLEEASRYIEEGQFGETNMLPKIEAAETFLSANPKGRVLITSMGAVNDALKGKAGTVISA